MEQFKAEVVTFTPELAADFLKMNTRNRRKDENSISAYAIAMQNGKWMLNGEPIIISDTNVILDGQNRLHACVKAGVPFETLLVWGITEESFKTIDIGKARTAGDILTIENIKNATTVSAAITRYFRLSVGRTSDTGAEESSGGTRLSKIGKSKSDVLDFYRANEATCQEVGEHVVSLGQTGRMIMNGSVIGGYELYLIIEKKHDKETVYSFFNQLVTGKNVENNTILLLRDALIRHKMKQKVLTGKQRSVYFAKTWNAYVTGKELKVLAYHADLENNPTLLI